MRSRRSCGIMIKQIHDALEKHANNALRSQGLTMTQITTMLALNSAPDKRASLKELEKILHVAQSTTAGIIARLEQKKFVEGFTDSSDQRVKLAKLTPLGEQCCIDAERSMVDAEQKLLFGLSDSEKDTLYKLLERVGRNMK